jgi:hypothetical protein
MQHASHVSSLWFVSSVSRGVNYGTYRKYRKYLVVSRLSFGSLVALPVPNRFTFYVIVSEEAYQ